MRAGNGGRDEAAASRGGQRSRSGRRAAAAWGRGTCGRRLRGAPRARRGAGVVEEHADRGGVGRGVPLRAGEKGMPGPHHGVVGSRQWGLGRTTATTRRRGGRPSGRRHRRGSRGGGEVAGRPGRRGGRVDPTRERRERSGEGSGHRGTDEVRRGGTRHRRGRGRSCPDPDPSGEGEERGVGDETAR